MIRAWRRYYSYTDSSLRRQNFEIVVLTRIWCVWNIFLRQLLYRSEDSIRATSAKCRMKREMVHQMSSDILNTWATTEVDTHEWTDVFAVLITNDLHLRPRVESITDDNAESNCSMNENIPPKGVSFSDLICIFAMSIVGFSCLFLQH